MQKTIQINPSHHQTALPPWYDMAKIWNPSWFQGNRKKSGYFEGWYLKSCTADGRQTMAFIPGISLADGDAHAFVQAIDGQTGKTWYFRFAPDDFSFSKHAFDVRVGDNHFSKQGMTLNLQSDTGSFKGELRFSQITPYKAGLIKPGIMGWYRYVPFMECYHGVVSLNHRVDGQLIANQEEIHFEHGKGYIEKDWGTSMPEAWIWMQTNHFENPTTSFMLSVAKIPWMGKSFTGFLGFFLHEGTRYDFATYTGAKIRRIVHKPANVKIDIVSGQLQIGITAENNLAGALKAPVAGTMERVIHESVDGHISLEVFTRQGKLLFRGTGKNAGLEIVGDQQKLLASPKKS